MPESMDRLERVAFLASAEGQVALRECRSLSQVTVGVIKRLRDRCGIANANAVLEQCALTEALRLKFNTTELLATDRSLQQSSDRLSAAYKAQRFPKGEQVYDWCHGMGGDLRALAEEHPCIGVDRDRELHLIAQFNVPSAELRCDNVENHLPRPGSLLHIDPDRRTAQGRTSQPEFSSPDLDVLQRGIYQSSGTAIKLAPAAGVPDDWMNSSEREWITVAGSCRQQVVWFGMDALQGLHRATLLHSERPPQSFQGTPSSDCRESFEVLDWIYDVDPSIRASGLSATWANTFNLSTLGGPSGFFTSSERIKAALGQPFRVLAKLPLDDRKLRARCRELSVDIQEVKTRGVDRTPEKMRSLLRLPGEKPATLMLGRSGGEIFAVIALRDGA